MSIGDRWHEVGMGEMDKQSSIKLLDANYEAGGNFIDTSSNRRFAKSAESPLALRREAPRSAEHMRFHKDFPMFYPIRRFSALCAFCAAHTKSEIHSKVAFDSFQTQ
jgi:hypothetical protein